MLYATLDTIRIEDEEGEVINLDTKPCTTSNILLTVNQQLYNSNFLKKLLIEITNNTIQ